MSHVRTAYLDPIYGKGRLPQTVTKVSKTLQSTKIKYEAIAFTGTSGAAVAFPLGIRLKKSLICVRKDKSHTGRIVEGIYGVRQYVIVDDFISTGATMRRIIEQIEKAYKADGVGKPKCVGIFLYNLAYDKKRWETIPVTYCKEMK